MKIEIGCLSNSKRQLEQVLMVSDIGNRQVWVHDHAESAAKGYNQILDVCKGDALLICHHDVYLPPQWFNVLEYRLSELPEDWAVVGFYGLNEAGEYCGKIHDRRTPIPMITPHQLPAKAISVDGCCMLVRSDFRFDENLVGFDMYDAYACMKNKGKSWIVDCMPEHYPTRSWDWKPDPQFMQNVQYLKQAFPNEKIITTCYAEA